MFKKIMVPVDLLHLEDLERALDVAADLAKHFKAEVVYVGVTFAGPTRVALSPEEYQTKLDAFAAAQNIKRKQSGTAHAVFSHDPTTDVDDKLVQTVDDLGADLVVMASHLPKLTDYIWPSNGGKVAAHSKASVFVVRG